MRNWEHKLDFNEFWHIGEEVDELQHERDRWTDPRLFEMRDGIVSVMKTLPQYTEDQDSDDFQEEIWWIVDEMSDVTNSDWFNQVWEGFYDWCDSEGVWVDIHKKPEAQKVYEVDGFIMGTVDA